MRQAGTLCIEKLQTRDRGVTSDGVYTDHTVYVNKYLGAQYAPGILYCHLRSCSTIWALKNDAGRSYPRLAYHPWDINISWIYPITRAQSMMMFTKGLVQKKWLFTVTFKEGSVSTTPTDR